MSPILSWLVFLSRYSWSCNIFHLLHQIRDDLEIFSHYKSTVIKKKISNCTTALVSDTTLQNQNTVYRWAAAHVTEACVWNQIRGFYICLHQQQWRYQFSLRGTYVSLISAALLCFALIPHWQTCVSSAPEWGSLFVAAVSVGFSFKSSDD